MKRTITIIVCIMLVNIISFGEAPLRLWKTVNGNSVKAKYIKQKNGRVELQNEEGKNIIVSISVLSVKDKNWIKHFEEVNNPVPIIKPPASKAQLPVFGNGKNKGFNAVYKADKFDAYMKGDGQILIYPKGNDGKRVGKPMRCSLRCYYNDGHHRNREVRSYTKPPAPVKQPKVITLSGKLVDNVKFSVTYEFSDNGIKGYGYCKDPGGIKYKTRFRILVVVPPSHQLKADMSRFDLNKLLVGWNIVLISCDGKKRIVPYSQPQRSLFERDKKVVIDAPVYGDRKISFKAGKPDEAPLIPYIYSGNCPWQAYAIQLIKDDNKKKSKSQNINIIVE